MNEREQLEDSIAALAAQRGAAGEAVSALEQRAAGAAHTLLFTDVVDSTLLVERLGDVRAAEIWAEHDRRARELLARHNGREIDRTDGFFLLFDDARDAAQYAVTYHQVLTGLGLHARVGLHVGQITLHENPSDDVARGAKRTEVEGLAKPVAARVMALARGGQTLLTAAACAALSETLPSDAETKSHGFYRFKGIEEPIEVFELGIADSALFLPPADADKAYRVVHAGDLWCPAREIRHNLPAERDAFVGRATELRALASRLDAGARLITVLGPGGTGKTRFVRRYSWTWLGDWPGGIYFCDLSEAHSLDGIHFAVASALEVPLGKDDSGVQLGKAIAGRDRCLVILDNFEQVVAHAPVTLGPWLDRAASAAFVVTSRERLQLPGEEIFLIEPLSLQNEAIDLFVARARSQRSDFVLSEANHSAIAEIVRLLDGMPLAIELAAARVAVLSPSQLVERLRDRFNVLAHVGGATARQATLRATIDWSWGLLASWEQAALAQCSIFEGDFTLEAAEAVLDLSSWSDAPSAVDVVQALVDKSLLRASFRAQQQRHNLEEVYFGMYLSIHEYAAQKLTASEPMARQATEERHGRYFAAFGTDDALEALFRHGGVQRRGALALRLDNLVAACRRAMSRGDGATAVASYRAAWEVLELNGPFALGDDLGKQVLAMEEISASLRSAALLTRALSARRSRRMEDAAKLLEQSLALSREIHDRRIEGSALAYLGAVRREQSHMEEAEGYFERALATIREVEDRRMEGFVLGSLGFLYHARGQIEQARAYYEKALAVLREVGDRRFETFILANLSELHYDQGRVEEANLQLDEAFVATRELGNRRFEGILLGTLGNRCRDEGRLEEARGHYDAALVMIREIGDRNAEGFVLDSLAKLLILQGEIGKARQLLGEGEALLREVGNSLDLAKLLCTRGRAEIAAGDVSLARASLAETDTMAAMMNVGPDSELGHEITKLRETLAIANTGV